MDRRGFLSALAALPGLGWFAPAPMDLSKGWPPLPLPAMPAPPLPPPVPEIYQDLALLVGGGVDEDFARSEMGLPVKADDPIQIAPIMPCHCQECAERREEARSGGIRGDKIGGDHA